MIKNNPDESVAARDSYKELASLLLEIDVPEEIGSFDDFVQNIFSKSYPSFDFNTWHVHHMCNQFQRLLDDPNNKYLEAVLPRYHLKSSVFGYATSIYRMLTSYGEGLYTSFKEELANIHLYHIKECIRNNEYLSKHMIDLAPQSDNIVNYRIGNRKSKIYSSGIMGVKRGLHTQIICVGDDLLGDLENPMSLVEIDKTVRIFDAEMMNIPNKDCPLVVFGTVISDSDLLFQLKDREKFKEHLVWMPALYPDGEHEVLWETMYNRDWLEQRKIDGGWKAFSTEFLLIPVMSTEAFFNKDQLDTVINKELINYQIPFER